MHESFYVGTKARQDRLLILHRLECGISVDHVHGRYSDILC
jgi:hypothetical protein